MLPDSPTPGSANGTPACSRRSILWSLLLGLLGDGASRALAGQSRRSDEVRDEAEEIKEVEELAIAARLGAFRRTRTEHFLGMGNAPDRFMRDALERCESLGKAFLSYFNTKGFKVGYPEHRLMVVALKDSAAYAAFVGHEPAEDEGGHYDVEKKRLVIFDFRTGPRNRGDDSTRINLFALVHETAHQLCFNTGLLNPRGDLPLCFKEGFATFVEMWQPGVKNAIGGTNRPRLLALSLAADSDKPWIPIPELVADDKLFDSEQVQLAYAESWLLVHYLLRSRSRLPRLRDYLAGTVSTPQGNLQARVKDAERHLGKLERLDREVKDWAARLHEG